MVNKIEELSIFFPFWNEEKNIKHVVGKALEIAPNVARKWEIIIVDDGSRDKTLEIAEKFASKNKNVRIITHKPNRGYGAALKEGLNHARYKYVVFTDGDGQFDFSEVNKFVDRIDNADIVIGYRKKRRDHNLGKRLLLMNLLKIWDFVLFGFRFRDIDCGFKMFTRRSLDEILPLRSEGAMITTEILARAKRKNLKIEEVEVEHFPRKFGSQTGANFPVIVRAILESIMLWWDIRDSRI